MEALFLHLQAISATFDMRFRLFSQFATANPPFSIFSGGVSV
jgi:hypothetical protein